ncbi:MAG: hypothetical protein AAF447_23840 [Myxococcota bacterium]
MPLPTLVFFALASGVAAALAGRLELRLSPRAPLLTRSFGAYAIFAGLVLVPVSVYFYVFHGDWFLLYLLDVRKVPSAVAMVGFLLQLGLGALGFSFGASQVRAQRDGAALGAVLALLVLAVAVPFAARARLALVGSFAQFQGHFGLEPYGRGPLMQGAILMGAFLLVGLGALLLRLRLGGRSRA